MAIPTIQTAFSAGEITPQLWGREDLQKNHIGASTMRNFFANYRGGASSRAGTAYVGMCKQGAPNLGGTATSNAPRDIKFQFSLTQAYALEFGDNYMRIKTNGGYVLEATKSITSVSGATFTIPGHGFSSGDWVQFKGISGVGTFNGLVWIVQSTTTNTITVTDLFGVATSAAAAGTGGTAARIYTISTPYAAIDLPYLKTTQSADTMTLTCVNQETLTEYPSYSLVRNGITNWVLLPESFGTSISAPSGLAVTAQASTTLDTYYSYTVTAVASDGEESVAATAASAENNDIAVYAGSNVLSWNSVSLASSYNVYKATPAYNQPVPVGNNYGYLGTALGPSFVDTNITADFTQVPPIHNNPFARGAITDVVMTSYGSSLTQSGTAVAISSSTGSGFVGIPVINNGGCTDVIIQNGGSGYLPGDTVGIGQLATGTWSTSGNPTNGQTLILNGVTWTFVTGTPTGNQSQIQGSIAATVTSLAAALNASSVSALQQATYGTTTILGVNELNITATSPITGTSYTLATGTAGGTVSGATLTLPGGAVNPTATLSVGPQTGTYPGVCGYFQQRRVYAYSLNNPDTYWMSQTGAFKNFDAGIPISDSDSIIGTPWGLQVNGVQWMVMMPSGLVVLTGAGAWQLTGANGAAITPSNQAAAPQAYNGISSFVPPLPINYDILYVQAKGSIVRDLSYNFFVNIYTGTDLTVLSSHLFQGHTIQQWAWCEEPYKLVWAVREDGIMLALTYLKEQDVYAWSRHDTSGNYVGVCSITEPPVDALYLIVQRYMRGQWVYYSERMDNRLWTNVANTWCVDCGLSYPLNYPGFSILPPQTLVPTPGIVGRQTYSAPTDSSGNPLPVVFVTTGPISCSAGDVVAVNGGVGTVAATVINGTSVSVTVTQPLLSLFPAEPGSWSVTTPVTSITGLNHLEGQSVAILADGSVVSNQTVTNGAVTLPYAATQVTVGLPFQCQLQTLYLDPPNQPVTVQGRRKALYAATVRMDSSRGMKVGCNQPDASTQPNGANAAWSNLYEWKQRTSTTAPGTAIPLYTGDARVTFSGTWATQGQVAIQQDYPLPLNVLAVVPEYQVGDTPA